jgi:glycine/D-amino acid oxidase-like deaminating enzyme
LRVRSASPFWPIRDGLISVYPSLKRDVSTDVVVIGGGITGAMVAYHLARAGVETVILDKRDVGHGSTSASTAMLLYEIDKHLTDLAAMRGERDAVRCYRLCLESIHKLERIVRDEGGHCGYGRKKSLYLASDSGDVASLRKECETRLAYGFRVKFLEGESLRGLGPAAILSYDAAQVDPFSLTHLLVGYGRDPLIKAFDRTKMVELEATRSGVCVTTEGGHRVRAKRAVLAMGYESRVPRVARVTLKSTYAIVSEPMKGFPGWGHDRCIVWETARPYFYARTTEDGRAMVGGGDEDYVDAGRRDRLIPRKASALLHWIEKKFPLMDLEVAYAWAGTFGETEDSLPFIGEAPDYPNSYQALCYGANGTNFALMAAEIIRDLYLRRPNADSRLFRFDR